VTNDFKSVDKNRVQLAKKHHYDHNTLQYMEQVHSNIIKDIDFNKNAQKCDALITNKINTPLMVMVADCIPILFYDSVKKVIAVAHAGRAGTFTNISSNTIDKMIEQYACEAQNIEVLLGPSIQKCCYEVSAELVETTRELFGDEFINGRYIDLQGINKKQLLDKGIKANNIEILNICTKCSGKDYFSYRQDKTCGRFAGIIMIKG
jgi:YfiH family protein